MSNTVDKHTPGPWRVTTGKHSETTEMWDKGETWFNVNGEDGVIADVLYGRCLPCDEEEAEANAALIASAPTLKKENEELHLLAAELRSLKQTIAESGLKKLFPQKENISFHDKVVFAIHDMEERNRVLVEALQECREWYVNNADKIAPETPICFSKALSLIQSNQ